MNITTFLEGYNFFGFNPIQMLVFFGLILFTFLFAKFFSLIIVSYLKKYAQKTSTDFDDDLISAVEKPLIYLIYVIGTAVALFSLNPINEPVPLKNFINVSLEVSVALIITWFSFRLVDVFDKFLVSHLNKHNEDAFILHFFPLIKRSLKVALAFIALIIIVQNLGYSVTGLITGFGITGLAVGFAAKESIANIFGSFSVIVDHSYKIGDWIIVDKSVQNNYVEGIVEDISLRSTKIRAFDNTLIIIPNNEMAISTIKNVSKQKKRRIFEYIDITYNTPPDKVEKAVEICRQTVRNHPEMEEYFQIYLTELGAHSLKILFYVFTKTTDWGEYLKIRQELFLSIMREFEKLGVEFAFPTQTLYINENKVNSAVND